MQTQDSGISSSVNRCDGNAASADYIGFQGRLNVRVANVASLAKPIFHTDATDLWEIYLASFPTREAKQYANCNSCRHFVERYGDLVMVNDDGSVTSILWDGTEVLEEDRAGVMDMALRLRKAKVTGIFLSSEAMWGRHVTGIWRHMAVTPPQSLIFKGGLLDADQRVAVKKEDYKNICRALSEFNLATIEQAIVLLDSDALYRSEKVLGAAKWLRDLHKLRDSTIRPDWRSNLTWRAIALAPDGFCHPRASMIGTLLEDIEASLPFEEVSRRFKEKMHPLQYQRPQVAPTLGSIAAAEKMVEKLGIERSLHRRFARLEDLKPLWLPKVIEPKSGASIFAHLKAKGQELPILKVPAQTMTWDKFSRTVLPTADQIELFAPDHGPYCPFVTAEHADAPPILQWDNEVARNPVSWYFWYRGSPARQFNVQGSTWVPLTAVTLQPSMWQPGFDHQGKGVMFVIKGARDTKQEGNALFPENLKSHLREMKSVIEAYSKTARISGEEESSAAGIMVQPRNDAWNLKLRVTTEASTLEYVLDRWD